MLLNGNTPIALCPDENSTHFWKWADIPQYPNGPGIATLVLADIQ